MCRQPSLRKFQHFFNGQGINLLCLSHHTHRRGGMKNEEIRCQMRRLRVHRQIGFPNCGNQSPPFYSGHLDKCPRERQTASFEQGCRTLLSLDNHQHYAGNAAKGEELRSNQQVETQLPLKRTLRMRQMWSSSSRPLLIRSAESMLSFILQASCR
jgi:hypothetical protein